MRTQTHTHTVSILTVTFPGEPELASCPLTLLHLILNCTSFWDRPELSVSSLIQSHQVFFGPPPVLIPSVSNVIQHFTQSVSISFTFNMSKPSLSSLLDHQTKWFQSSQFPEFFSSVSSHTSI